MYALWREGTILIIDILNNTSLVGLKTYTLLTVALSLFTFMTRQPDGQIDRLVERHIEL